MNIIEVKNNLVKLCYENDLKLSELIKIADAGKEYIAQVIHLEATRIGKTAIAKIIFSYANGISAYDGSIPSLRAELEPVSNDIILKIINKENPLNLGKIAQEQNNLIVNIDILKDNPIICAEKYFTTKVLLNNIAMQLQARKEKIVVFDTVGVFKSNKITLTKDFRLPLNSSTINYIYEKGFEDATAESKALIQTIFEELSNYSKTVEYIPFDTFKAVIDAEFKRTQLMQLIILKNKIKQIRDWNVFAEKENDFKCLKSKIQENQTLVIDISCVKEGLQKECIKYIYNILNSMNEEMYVFTPLTDENSDKPMLQLINDSDVIHTTTICGYDYKYLQELKQRSKNMLMFTPLKQQQDFGGYNIFLKKLAEDEFIAYGKMTKFVPLIAKLHALSQSEIYVPAEIKETTPANTTAQESVESETNNVDEVVSTASDLSEEISEETGTIPNNESETLPEIKNEEPVIEESTEESPVAENEIEAPAESNEEAVREETIAEEPVQSEEVTSETTEPTEIAPEEILNEEPENVEEALAQVPEAEVDEELSDDDLDMIEQLSKPDEEIAALNTESSAAEEVAQNTPAEELPPAGPVAQEVVTETEPVTVSEIAEGTATEPVPATNEETTIPSEPPTEVPVAETVNEPTEIAEENTETAEKKTENEPIVENHSANSPESDTEEDEIKTATIPQESEPLQTRTNKTPVVPEYSAEIPDEDRINNEKYQEGDRVMHQEFGEGVVEKMINYGDKILCSINFTSVGRRLLNPEITEMSKI